MEEWKSKAKILKADANPQQIESYFNDSDSNKDGFLDLDEFRVAQKKASDATDNTKDTFWGFFSDADKDDDNQLSKVEWVTGYSAFDKSTSTTFVEQSFKEADKNSND